MVCYSTLNTPTQFDNIFGKCQTNLKQKKNLLYFEEQTTYFGIQKQKKENSKFFLDNITINWF